MSASTASRLFEEFRAGDRRACAKVVSIVEDESKDSTSFLDKLYPLTGRAFRVGITGPPGAGKSTLVEKLAQRCREQDKTVGIVAVDPTSPFSGGAVLGDRVRMPALFTDPGVFIRSMATRGGMGGLAVRTREVCDVLDAFGNDLVLIETVGVGQVELDIAAAADSTVVVLVPESGDAIQVMKAGLMEIGQVFCVNKSDRQSSDQLVVAIQSVLELRSGDDGWHPPVVKTVATTGQGIEELLEALDRHREYLADSARMATRRATRVREEIRELVEASLRAEVWTRADVAGALQQMTDDVLAGKSTPYQAARRIASLVRAAKGG